MSVPAKKASKRRKRARASHFALSKVKLSSCPKCKKPVLAHQVCQNCGFYKGQDILKLEAKLTKKALKEKKKREEREKKEEKKQEK